MACCSASNRRRGDRAQRRSSTARGLNQSRERRRASPDSESRPHGRHPEPFSRGWANRRGKGAAPGNSNFRKTCFPTAVRRRVRAQSPRGVGRFPPRALAGALGHTSTGAVGAKFAVPPLSPGSRSASSMSEPDRRERPTRAPKTPEVLSDATELSTLFEALIGSPSDAPPGPTPVPKTDTVAPRLSVPAIVPRPSPPLVPPSVAVAAPAVVPPLTGPRPAKTNVDVSPARSSLESSPIRTRAPELLGADAGDEVAAPPRVHSTSTLAAVSFVVVGAALLGAVAWRFLPGPSGGTSVGSSVVAPVAPAAIANAPQPESASGVLQPSPPGELASGAIPPPDPPVLSSVPVPPGAPIASSASTPQGASTVSTDVGRPADPEPSRRTNAAVPVESPLSPARASSATAGAGEVSTPVETPPPSPLALPASPLNGVLAAAESTPASPVIAPLPSGEMK